LLGTKGYVVVVVVVVVVAHFMSQMLFFSMKLVKLKKV
jgi:hypothetical protein